MIDCIQNDGQLLTLTLLRLRHLQHVQFAIGEFFPQFVQHLSVVHVVLQMFDNDALFGQFIVHPVDENLLQFDDFRIGQRGGLDYGTLLFVTCAPEKDKFS